MSEPRRPTRSRRASTSSLSPAALGVVKVGADFADEYPDGDPAKAEVMATLARSGSSILQEIERCTIATFGISHSMLNSLAVVDGSERPLTPSEIGERTFVSSGTVTGTLDQLEYRGWVGRIPNPDDRRSVFVEITEAGRLVADQFLPGIRALEQAVFAGLTQRELQTLMNLLGKVLEGIAAVAAAEPTPLAGRRIRPR